MQTIDVVARALGDLARELDAPALEPDPSRADWSAHRDRVAAVGDALERDVLPELEATLAAVTGDPAEVARARHDAASIVADAAALLWAAGDRTRATAGFSAAERVAPAPGHAREEFAAAQRTPDDYVALARARWLLAQRRWDEGDAALRALRRRTREPALRAAAGRVLDGPRPIQGAPPLFRLNGFGAALYGERDRRPDGSYVATYCVSALFIPVFPLRAYRVVSSGDGRYGFIAREPLSAFARGARALVLAAALAGVAFAGVDAWRTSPNHRLAVAIEHARAQERAHPDRALGEYERAAREYAGRAMAEGFDPLAASVVRLAAAAVREPVDPAQVERALHVAEQFEQLPSIARRPAAAADLTARLVRWSGQVGAATTDRGEDALRLLDAAARVAPPDARPRVLAAARATHRAMADRLAADWPLEALAHLAAAVDDPAAVRAAAPVVRTVAAAPSLAAASETDLVAWTRAARALAAPELVPVAAEADRSLEAARAMAGDAARTAALEHGEPAELEAALARHPGDHDVIATLAALRRNAGDAPGALAMLTALGPPGRLNPRAQHALAATYAEAGRLADADALLSRYVGARLPAYQSAQRALAAAVHAATERLDARVRANDVPQDLVERAERAPEAERGDLLRRWAAETIAAEPEVARLRAETERQSDLVGSVLMLGTVKLREANESAGEPRARLLADAERLFLAIREQAGDAPGYHLALGQVYHRLGRPADGDREFAAVMEGGDPEASLSVAETYRALGLPARAREVGQRVYDTAPNDEVRGAAASLMAHVMDRLEDERTWLERAPQGNENVRLRLQTVQARLHEREGRFAEADRLYAQVSAAYAREAEAGGGAAAANNRAVIEQARFRLSGDPARLGAAIESLEAALRAAPDQPIIVSNLAQLRAHHGRVRVLERFVRMSVLRLDETASELALGTLAEGPQRDAVLAALRSEPSARRGLELSRQHQALAPETTSSYDAERRHLVTLEDAAALRALRDRVARVAAFDTSEEDAHRERLLSGSDDAQLRQQIDTLVTDAGAVVTAAERAHHAPTLAAAHLLRAMRLRSRGTFTGDAADLAAAVAALRLAAATWPTLGVEQLLARTLFELGLARAAEGNAALAAALRADGRRYDADVLAHRATADAASGPAARVALRARPEVTEALGLMRAMDPARLWQSCWITANALGDAELEARAAPTFARETDALSLAIRARLEPHDADTQARVAIAQARQTAPPPAPAPAAAAH